MRDIKIRGFTIRGFKIGNFRKRDFKKQGTLKRKLRGFKSKGLDIYKKKSQKKIKVLD